MASAKDVLHYRWPVSNTRLLVPVVGSQQISSLLLFNELHREDVKWMEEPDPKEQYPAAVQQ